MEKCGLEAQMLRVLPNFHDSPVKRFPLLYKNKRRKTSYSATFARWITRYFVFTIAGRLGRFRDPRSGKGRGWRTLRGGSVL